MMAGTANRSSRRPVGAKAGIDLARIIGAARTIPADRLTMQAVATELGVDRSAINHHVSSRQQLLSLVAQASFNEQFSDIRVPADADWQEATRIFARAYVVAVRSAGALAGHISLDIQETRFLQATEAVLEKMIEAGFTDEFSVRFIVLLGHVAHTYARDQIDLESGVVQRRSTHTQAALEARVRSDYPVLDRVSATPFDTYGERQLEVSLDLIINGALIELERSQ